MSGFGAFFVKELREIARTWRIWVIPGMMLFFAVTSPIVALLTPTMLASLAGSQPGIEITIPDPTGADAYGQFIKNLSQLVTLALIIAGAGLVSAERSAGTAILVLTKPISRSAFVLAKLLAELLLLLVFAAIATMVCLAVTRLLFPPLAAAPLLGAVAVWLVSAALLVSVMTFCSVAFPSRGAAAGAGLGYLFATLLASIWPPAVRYSFVGLSDGIAKVLGSKPAELGWPLATAAIAAVAITAAAAWVFERQEL
ncbi:MAG: ABC transporter permease [Gemmatimonadetes bacterium]|nr:ABC transporter permease [Gemmatimonadota bacterium]